MLLMMMVAGGPPAQPNSNYISHVAQQLSAELGLSFDDLQVLDSEGRAIITDHGLFLLVNLYGESPLHHLHQQEHTFVSGHTYLTLQCPLTRHLSSFQSH